MQRIFKNISAFFLQYWKVFAALLVCAALVLAFAAARSVIQEKREKKINSLLFLHKDRLEKAGQKANGENWGLGERPLDLLSLKAQEWVYSQEMKTEALALDRLLRENASFLSPPYFAVELADFFFKNKDSERGVSLLRLFAEQNKFSTVYQLIRLQLALHYRAMARCAEALPVLEHALKEKRESIWKSSIYFYRGLCHEETGAAGKAAADYKKTLQIQGEGPMALAAKDRLLVLRLKSAAVD